MRWALVLLVGCGGATTGGDASVDGAVPADASIKDSGDASVLDSPVDGTVFDAGADGGCSTLTAMGCTTCCINSAGGTGGFELLYYNQCLQCASCGPNVRPCGTNMSPPASGACIGCLKMSLMQGQPWTMCQQDVVCKAFVTCFANCPTM